MLGLGRALGETMAVLMILSPGFLYSFQILVAGQQQTIAANIAAQFAEVLGKLFCVLLAEFFQFHHSTVRATNWVCTESLAAARRNASRASTSAMPSISYNMRPG